LTTPQAKLPNARKAMHMKYLLLALAISSASVFAEEEPF